MIETGRYDVSGLIEAQHQPGSRGRVLRNLRGITRKREMDEAEARGQKRALEEIPTEMIFTGVIERTLRQRGQSGLS